MNWKDWLRMLLGVSVLLGIAEMLLPPGNMAKFSRLVLGLTLMLAVLQPISNLLSLNPVTVDLNWPNRGLSEPEIASTAARMQLAGAKSILRAEGGSLARQIEDLLLAETALTKARVEVGSGFSSTAATILIEPYNQQLQGEVQNIVSGILNLKTGQIDVRELGK